MKSLRSKHSGRRRSNRRGLAPLELVLSLPLILCVTALIIDFGNMAPWKIRAAVVAREVVWRQHWPHHGEGNARPAGWPTPSSQPLSAAAPFRGAALGRSPLQEQLISDPFTQNEYPVVRGTIGPLVTDSTKLDFTAGWQKGISDIEVRWPLSPKIRSGPFGASFQFHVLHPLLDNQFHYDEMGYTRNDPLQGYPRHVYDGSRRALKLYPSPPFNQGLSQRFTQTIQRVRQILGNRNPTEFTPTTPGVLTLNGTDPDYPGSEDDEFFKYGVTSPGFHPQVRRPRDLNPPCDTDRELVRMEYVTGPNGVVNRIQGRNGGGRGGLPDRISDAFIQMYQQQIDRLKLQQPPPQPLIDALQKKIDQLNQFKASLS